MIFKREKERLGQPLDIFIVNSFGSLFQVSCSMHGERCALMWFILSIMSGLCLMGDANTQLTQTPSCSAHLFAEVYTMLEAGFQVMSGTFECVIQKHPAGAPVSSCMLCLRDSYDVGVETCKLHDGTILQLLHKLWKL